MSTSKVTSRGFRIYGEFTVVHGVRLRVIESSADPLEDAHIFAEDKNDAYGHRSNQGGRGHEVCCAPIAVNVEQAEELIRALQAFIAHKRGT